MITEIILGILNSDMILIIIMFMIISIIMFHINVPFKTNQLINLTVINDEMIIRKIYTIKCHRCKEFIYDSDICYDNITKYPYHKKCLDVYDYNTEKLHQTT